MTAAALSELEAYRRRAREFLQAHAPTFARPARNGLSPEQDLALARRWQRTKADHGYAAISWPRDYSGAGGTQLQQAIFVQEELPFGFPTEYFAISLGMPVPMMLRYATEAQKQRFIVPAVRGDEIWCQLFSEPAAGSDLAALRMRARRSGEDWILTGQKVWTTYAHISDYGVAIARHDPRLSKHKGLTYFWIDMRARGVTVRPIRQLSDKADFCEVFFDDVLVADSQRLGGVGEGFKLAIETLFIERYVGGVDEAANGPRLGDFIALAEANGLAGAPAIEDGAVRREIALAYAAQNALREIQAQAFLELATGREAGPEGSIQKLVAGRVRQRLSTLALDIMGPSGVLYDRAARRNENWSKSWLDAPIHRIAGGTDEILLNTIAEKVLGLPQDHRPDKNRPFEEGSA